MKIWAKFTRNWTPNDKCFEMFSVFDKFQQCLA